MVDILPEPAIIWHLAIRQHRERHDIRAMERTIIMPGMAPDIQGTVFHHRIAAVIIPAAMLVLSCGAAVNTAAVPSPRPESWWAGRSVAFNEECRARQPRLVFLGDSITRGWVGAGNRPWKRHFAKLGAANFGIPSDRVEHLLWRVEHGNIAACEPAAAVLLVGTNNRKFNTPREIGDGIGAVVGRLRKTKPGMKIIVLSILPCGGEPNELRDTLMKANDHIAKLHDGKTVFFVDIARSFILPDGTIPRALMPDFIHPSEAGYDIIAAALLPVLGGAPGPLLPR